MQFSEFTEAAKSFLFVEDVWHIVLWLPKHTIDDLVRIIGMQFIKCNLVVSDLLRV